jgi:hypothetical protein
LTSPTTLVLSLSKDEPRRSWFDKLTTSDVQISDRSRAARSSAIGIGEMHYDRRSSDHPIAD